MLTFFLIMMKKWLLLKNIPILRLEYKNYTLFMTRISSIPYLLKNHTLWGRTYLYRKCTIKLNANSLLQTASVSKSNFTRPIGCRVLAVKCSKSDHLNLEECTRQLTRMMDLMPSDFAAVNSTLPACAMIPNQQNFTRHDERFNF